MAARHHRPQQAGIASECGAPTPRISNPSPYFTASPGGATTTTAKSSTKTGRRSEGGGDSSRHGPRSRQISSAGRQRHSDQGITRDHMSFYPPSQKPLTTPRTQSSKNSKQSTRHQPQHYAQHPRQRRYSEEHRQALSGPVERESHTPLRESLSPQHHHATSPHQQQQRNLEGHHATPHGQSKRPKSHTKNHQQQAQIYHASPLQSSWYRSPPPDNSNDSSSHVQQHQYAQNTLPPPRSSSRHSRDGDGPFQNGHSLDLRRRHSDQRGSPSRHRQCVDCDRDNYRLNNLKPARRSSHVVRKKSHSTCVAEMAASSDVSGDYFSPQLSHHQIGTMVIDDGEVDNADGSGSKKSKSSKGLLSRASKKIKKRLVGGRKEKGKDAADGKKQQQTVINISYPTPSREGRDPSPTDEGRQRSAEGGWAHSGGNHSDNHHRHPRDHGFRDGYQELIDSFPSLDAAAGHSSGSSSDSDDSTHDSTLTTNFTTPLPDENVVDVPPTKNMKDLMPRIENFLATAPTVSENRGHDNPSRQRQLLVKEKDSDCPGRSSDRQEKPLSPQHQQQHQQSPAVQPQQPPSQQGMMDQYLTSKDEEISARADLEREESQRELEDISSQLKKQKQQEHAMKILARPNEQAEKAAKASLSSWEQQRQQMQRQCEEKDLQWHRQVPERAAKLPTEQRDQTKKKTEATLPAGQQELRQLQQQRRSQLLPKKKLLWDTSMDNAREANDVDGEFCNPRPESFAEKKHLIQMSLNFDKFKKEPHSHRMASPNAVGEGGSDNTGEASLRDAKSPLPKPNPRLLEQRCKQQWPDKFSLHANLMKEMMVKLAGGKDGISSASTDERELICNSHQQQSHQPSCAGHNQDKGRFPSGENKDERKRENNALSLDMQHMKERWSEQDKTTESRHREELKAYITQIDELKRDKDALTSELQRMEINLREKDEMIEMTGQVSQEQSEELKNYSQQGEKLRRENGNLLSELQRMKQRLVEQEDKMNSASQASRKQSEEMKDFSQQREELRHKNSTLALELQCMKQRLVKQDEMELKRREEFKVYANQNDELRHENDALTSQLQHMKMKLNEREEMIEMASQASSNQNKRLEEFSQQKEVLRRENDNISSELQRMKRKLAEQEEEIDLASQASRKRSKELKDFSHQREDLRRENNSLLLELQRMKETLVKQEEKISLASQTSMEQSKKLKFSLEQREQLKQENAKMSSELHCMKHRLVEQEEEIDLANEASRKQTQELQVFSKQSDELRQENNNLSLELQRMKQRFVDQEEEVDLANQSARKQSQELEAFLERSDGLRQENDDLFSELQLTKRQLIQQDEMMELASQASSKYNKELKSFSTQSNELKQENDTLSSELQRIKKRLVMQEEDMEIRKSATDKELLRQKRELDAMKIREEKLKATEAVADAKVDESLSQLSNDLAAYKEECASYRQRILQNEREHAKIQLLLLEENEKVKSLESKNQMLLNIAEDNKSSATHSEKVKQNEVFAYREQCDKYRQQVLDLERKVLATEGALEGMTQIISELKQDKKTLSAQLHKWKCNNTTLQTKLVEKDAKLVEKESLLGEQELERESLQAQLSTLKTKWSAAEVHVAESEVKAAEFNKTISVLESENATLLRKFHDSNTSLQKLHATVAERSHQLEEENATLKKRNDDMTAREIEMSKQMNDAQGLASNTERLHKMMADSERYISKLQDDISQARTSHFESLQSTRAKYSAEIDNLTDKLLVEKEARHITETKNNDLEDKLVSMKSAYSELEQLGTHQSKSHSEKIMKLMHHADDSRKKHAECQEEVASLRHELVDRLEVHDRLVKELQGTIELLEKEKSDGLNCLASANAELLQIRGQKVKEVQDLELTIKEKENSLVNLQEDFLEYASNKTNDVERLNKTIRQIQPELEQTASSRNALKKQVYEMKQHFIHAMNSMRIEKKALLSDVRSQLLDERVTMMEQVKDMVAGYGQNTQTFQLEQSMSQSVAMSTAQSEKRDIEHLLNVEQEKSRALEKSLDKVRSDHQALTKILNNACAKLSVSKKEEIIDSIDDLLIKSSDSRIQIKTLEVDVTALTTKNSNVEYENDELSTKLRERAKEVNKLELELERTCNVLRVQMEQYSILERKLENLQHEAQSVQNQMKEAFDADRRSQDKSVEEIILAKEEALSSQKEIQEKFEALTKESAARDEQLVAFRGKVGDLRREADESKQEYDDLACKHEECRQELASLLDKTVTSKNKADELMAHYMEIEDKLRKQLQSVQCEKEDAEKMLAKVQRESDHMMDELCEKNQELISTLASKEELIQELEEQIDEMKNSEGQDKKQFNNLSNEILDLKNGFYKEKHDLTSILSSKKASIHKLERQIVDMKENESKMHNQFHTLSIEVADTKQGNKELREQYQQVCSERKDLMNKSEKLASSLNMVQNQLNGTLAGLESSKKELNFLVDSERLQHTNAMEAIQTEIRRTTGERDLLSEQVQKCSTALESLQRSHHANEVIIEELTTTLEKERLMHTNAMDTLQNDIGTLAVERDSLSEQVQNLVVERDLLSEQVQNLSTTLQRLQASSEELKSTLDDERRMHTNGMEAIKNDISSITMERDSLTRDVHKLSSAIQDAKVRHETSQDAKDAKINVLQTTVEHLQNSADRLVRDNDSMSRQMEEMTSSNISLKSTMEAERLMHAGEQEKLQSLFASEMGQQGEKFNLLSVEAQQLREEVDELNDQNNTKEQQIVELKDSLNDALGEALRLGSKVTSEQAKLAELSHSMSSFEEEHSELKRALRQAHSEVDDITTRLSSQEADNSRLKMSLAGLAAEKQLLEAELSKKKTKLFETMNQLTHFELKLTKAEQERDGQSERDLEVIMGLQNNINSMEATHEEKELDLKNQIMALKKDGENDNIHNQLLEKMNDMEAYCSSRILSSEKDIYVLKKEIKSLIEEKDQLAFVNDNIVAENHALTDEKNRLTLVNDYIVAENSCQAENLASLESKLAEKDDVSSTVSSATRASHLKQTASELETTLRAIKKHHSDTVKRLQGELDDARKRLKRYERKVKDLTTLLEENSYVIESLHKKLLGKKGTRHSSGALPRPSHSIDSMVSNSTVVSG